MEAALEERPPIEGSATEVDTGSNAPIETGSTAVPAEQAGVAPANQAQAMPTVRDVLSQPAVRRAMPARRSFVLAGGADFLVGDDVYALPKRF